MGTVIRYYEAAVPYAKGGTLWEESEHPRGQPENQGQFVSKGSEVSDQPFSLTRESNAPKPKFENIGGKQGALFSAGGEPGQMNLFRDAGVPDEMLPKHLRG